MASTDLSINKNNHIATEALHPIQTEIIKQLTAWDGVDSTAPAEPENPATTTRKPVSDLYRYHDALCEEIDTILESKIDGDCFDHIQFERLQKVMNKYNALMLHVCSQTHHEFIHAMNDQTMEIARRIQKTYNSWLSIAITTASAALSIAGGIAGVAPISGAFSAAAVGTLSSASQGLDAAGRGVGAIGSIFDKRSEGERVILQVEMRRAEAKESEHKESRRQHAGKADQAHNHDIEANRIRADLWRTFST